jgi:anthranilate synthase component II
MKILLIDNYDSFTFNLMQLLHEAGAADIQVKKNNKIKLQEAAMFDAIVISPGPGLPVEAGITCELIRRYSGTKRILGVCLGMQAMAEVFGGILYQPGDILHGEMATVSPVEPLASLFSGLGQSFEAGLYHSWAVDKETLPDCLRITAVDGRGVIMGLSHTEFNVCGVQFHPESIMTPMGKKLMENWLQGW